MWDLWFYFFYDNVFYTEHSMLDVIEFPYGGGNNTLDMHNYLSGLSATIMVIVIYVICCLCIWKVIKLIGRLFVRL